jgi:hypothetical protein
MRLRHAHHRAGRYTTLPDATLACAAHNLRKLHRHRAEG